jgi:transcriptional regulator with XRE-family HTH domain
MASTDPPIGAVLRDFRVQRGLSHEQVAATAKMHRNYVGGVERGEKSPTMKTVGRILAVLGVSWSDLEARRWTAGTGPIPPRICRLLSARRVRLPAWRALPPQRSVPSFGRSVSGASDRKKRWPPKLACIATTSADRARREEPDR